MGTARKGDEAIFSRGRTYYVEGVGILFDWGETVPADGTADYAIGAIFQHVDGAAATCLYVNEGSLTSCDFNAASSAAAAALETALALATTPGGASKIGVYDTVGYWTGTTLETILAEIGELLKRPSGTAAGLGPSPLIWDACPILEMMVDPTIGFYYFEDYMNPIDITTTDGYTITAVNSGGISAKFTQGGQLLVDSQGNGAADDGVNVQLPNCAVLPAAGTTIRFEARVAMKDTGDDQYFIGLAAIDTTLIAAGILDDVVDKVGWFRIAASTADRMSVVTARTSDEDVDADKATVADNTFIKLGFVIDGLTSVKWYANGVLVHTSSVTTQIANAAMSLSYVAQVEQTSADAELSVDWVRIAQTPRV